MHECVGGLRSHGGHWDDFTGLFFYFVFFSVAAHCEANNFLPLDLSNVLHKEMSVKVMIILEKNSVLDNWLHKFNFLSQVK
jgi:hypothetical protein